jgi:hypothetical protein
MNQTMLLPPSSQHTLTFLGIFLAAISLALLTLYPLATDSVQEALATTASANATGGSTQTISQQGLVTSSTDPLPGHETHQSAVILRLRADNAVYDGTLTFTASKPVEVQVLHRAPNSTVPTIPTEFGTLNVLPLPGGEGSVTISNIIPQYQEGGFVASLPFSGNAISLHNIDGEPFAASYSVTADVNTGVQRADDISAVETPTELQAITEELQSITEEQEDETADEDESDNDGNDNDNDSNNNDEGDEGEGGSVTGTGSGEGQTPQ